MIYNMKHLMTVLVSAAAMLAAVPSFAVSIVPQPVSIKENRSVVQLPQTLTFYGQEKALKSLVDVWGESFAAIASVRTGSEKKADVKLYLDPAMEEEEYTLEVSAGNGAVIKGGSSKGVWWGMQTLAQVLLQTSQGEGKPFMVPGLMIQDKPHFGYRSGMLDCCRHFFTVDEVKKYIDILALHKLNTFHWHLTDDQGWRIEIKKYPLLTEVGSVRKETLVGHLSEKPEKYDGTPYGGYYTQKDIKDIVAYAAARQITIIPEIEMPGHAVAALTAYPWLGCRGEGYEVWTKWGISEDVFCIGRESTFDFLEDVLDEVCDLFPGEYIHIGGDEAPAVRRKDCPDCQARMKAEGIADETRLQGYLLKRIEKYLNDKGRHIIGWDEILDAGVTPTATVMSWRGPEGGIRAAKQGNHVIMSPNTYFYLDYYQTSDPKKNGEPLGIGGYVPLSKCYSFDPYDKLSEDEKQYIKGVQANLWAEYIATFDHVQQMILPRYCALSEVDWSEKKTSLEDFKARVKTVMLPMYDRLGLNYAKYGFDE